MKIKVGVFFGGESCEHEISCITANQVLHALDSDKYEVIPVYIAKNRDLYTGDELFDLSNYYSLNELVSKLKKISLVKDGNKVYIKPVKSSLFEKKETIDVAFLAVHGTNGEDGTLQGFMEMMKLPYTSCDVLGSAIGQDKAIMKEIFAYEGIPMVDWTYFYYDDYAKNEASYLSRVAEIGYPVIIKPANLGSSIGIEVAHDEEEFKNKVKEVKEYDLKIVVEKLIQNLKEVNCSVMGSLFDAKASPIEEVLKGDEILSFEDKYVGNAKGSKGAKGAKVPQKGSKGMATTKRKVPADLTDEATSYIKNVSLKVFKALNANGCVRIDFMIDRDTDKIYVNEINTIPGSLAFYLWNEEGIDFSKECDILIENALKRYRIKEKMTFSFDTNILSTFRRK
ncbi:MAG: D-alanine--D-alanine ligase family protein [Erysipelotrichaceae bacterium]|nr:D-alanine--D-alanine ligase family protein [Erysipelotrichaceae bacterium]